VSASGHFAKGSSKDRGGVLAVLKKQIARGRLGTEGKLLALGSSEEDASILQRAGFSQITLSNFPGPGVADLRSERTAHYLLLDAEQIDLPDNSFDIVFAHEVLHHCRSPHKALCEMLRVASRYVVFIEPNDCASMATLRRLRLSFPFEIPAVVANGFVMGGVRNTQVPNFIFRWNAKEVYKTATACLPERILRVNSYPFWELNATEYELEIRTETKLGVLMRLVGGARNFAKLLRLSERALNSLPWSRRQGNKFFCCVEKTEQLREWLRWENGEVVFDRSYVGQDAATAGSQTVKACQSASNK
jgi:SAM-dependent methyltransferase